MRNDFCSNYLEHSAKGTSWKKKGAKYISRVWKNGRWVYEYKISGKGYLKTADSFRKRGYRAAKVGNKAFQESNGAKLQAATKQGNYYITKEHEAMRDYYDKSLAGITEKTIENGKNIISNFLDSLKPTTTVTVETYGSGNLRSVNKRDLTKSKKK